MKDKEILNCRECMLVKNTKVPICNYHQGIQAEKKRILKLINGKIRFYKWIDTNISKQIIRALKELKKEVENENSLFIPTNSN